MALKERVVQEDLILFEILRNPVLCGEFINNVDRQSWEEEFEFTSYQREMLCDFNDHVSFACGRAVGKCLSEDSKIMNPETGEYRTVKEWFFRGGLNTILSIDDAWKQKISKLRIEPNGNKNIFQISTQAGYQVKVTEEHPLLTNYGFKKASQLKVGDFIAAVAEQPFFGTDDMDNSEVSILAHFIAEGTYHIGAITTTEPEVVKDIYDYASFAGCSVRPDRITYHIVGKSGRKNNYLLLLESNGMRNCHSYDKFIPQSVFRLNKSKLSLFLNKLFGDDGWVLCNGNNNEIGYSSTSERLARDVFHLLLRFGITASLQYKNNAHLGSWNLSIKGYDNFVKFRNNIGFSIPRKQTNLDNCINKSIWFHNQFDIIPIPDYYKYKYPCNDRNRPNIYLRKLRYYPTRKKIPSIVNPDDELKKYAQSHIRWVKITDVSIMPDVETYSIEVDNTNTLVADDVYSHNTVSLVNLIIWLMVNNVFPNDYINYHVPGKSHLEPVFTGLVRSFRTNSLLKLFLDKRSGINASDMKIQLNNNSQLLCRIAGQSGTGAPVVGLHSPFSIVDEAGYYPYGTWNELLPTLNWFTPGSRLMVSGVPTGLRERNVLWHADQENSSFTHHRISCLENPRFSEEDEQRAAETYGGRDTDDYIHLVLGQHGKPVFALFDRNSMSIASYPVFKIAINGTELQNNLSEYISKLSALPGLPDKKDECIFGIDLGFTEPTAIFIFQLLSTGIMRFHGKIQLNKVNYFIQEKIIDWLDSRFEPMLIAIDEGSAGKAVIPRLREAEEFLHKNFKDRIIPINFSSSVVLGYDTNGEELKNKTKPFAVGIAQDYTVNHKIQFSYSDTEFITELERMTYSKTPTGEIVYKTLTERGGKKGEDHFTSALLCAVLGYYLKMDNFNFRPQKVKLIQPRWVMSV